ncbi:MAG: cation-efflux pump [Alphaproteobacteria bacterium]|nr:cation-efflux pump [Alphaproteobacteria bacterium]
MDASRDTAHERKKAAALASIFASAALTIGKLVAGLLSGSLALISEALHGILDTGATIMTYFAVRISGKPADEEHRYGHGKVEAVAALAETGLLAVLAAGVLYEAFHRLISGEAPSIHATWLTYGVLIVSIIVDFVRWRALSKIAQETRSDALAADALHFSSDLIASALVLAGLIAVQYGFKHGDTLAAIGVSLFIAIAAYRLGKRTINTLIDAAPAGMTEQMSAALDDVPGVIKVESLRLRPAGHEVFGEASIAVARTLPAERIIEIREAAARMLREKFPDASVTLRATPRALDSESIMDRVVLIAARRHTSVHHVTVQEIGGKTSVSMDVELDGRMSLREAHDIASALEDAIESELGNGVEVETHIEPLEIRELLGKPAEAGLADTIRESLTQLVNDSNIVRNVHDLRVRSTPAGLTVNYHCQVNGDENVADTHKAVDLIEQRMRERFPAIVRIVGHAEPAV